MKILGGWMLYALPPAEIAVHPSDERRLAALSAHRFSDGTLRSCIGTCSSRS